MNNKFIKTLTSVTMALATSDCALGGNYKRPLVAVPTNFRAEPASATAPEAAPTIGDEQWVKIFEDATLQRLVQEALQNNLDVRIAAQRVLEAQAQVGITRSQQLPSVTGGANYSPLQIPSSLAGKNTSCAAFEVGYESASQFNREYSRFFGQPPCEIFGPFALRELGRWSRLVIFRTLSERLAAESSANQKFV